MTKIIEVKGESIDAAINNGLAQLGVGRDDVSVEVISKPKSGFFGIGREPAVVKITYETSPGERAKNFIEGLLIRLGVSARIDTREDKPDKTIYFELFGDNMGLVIGRRGDTLDAIQYLTSIITNRDENDRWRIVIDTENYRAKRETALEELARKTAEKAVKYKKSVALEPMNPHDRRIVHSALQGVPGVSTYSTGVEPNRKVIVAPQGAPVPNQAKKPAPQGGSAAPKTGGGTGKSRSRNNRRRKPANKPAPSKPE